MGVLKKAGASPLSSSTQSVVPMIKYYFQQVNIVMNINIYIRSPVTLGLSKRPSPLAAIIAASENTVIALSTNIRQSADNNVLNDSVALADATVKSPDAVNNDT
jgi:hypothetical protein